MGILREIPQGIYLPPGVMYNIDPALYALGAGATHWDSNNEQYIWRMLGPPGVYNTINWHTASAAAGHIAFGVWRSNGLGGSESAPAGTAVYTSGSVALVNGDQTITPSGGLFMNTGDYIAVQIDNTSSTVDGLSNNSQGDIINQWHGGNCGAPAFPMPTTVPTIATPGLAERIIFVLLS